MPLSLNCLWKHVYFCALSSYLGEVHNLSSVANFLSSWFVPSKSSTLWWHSLMIYFCVSTSLILWPEVLYEQSSVTTMSMILKFLLLTRNCLPSKWLQFICWFMVRITVWRHELFYHSTRVTADAVRKIKPPGPFTHSSLILTLV